MAKENTAKGKTIRYRDGTRIGFANRKRWRIINENYRESV